MTNNKSTAAIPAMLAVALGTVLFSAKAIIIKLAYRYPVDALTLLALRMLFALPFYLVIAYLTNRKARKLSQKQLWSIIGYGLSGYYLASMFDFIGLTYISVNLERLLLYVYPAFVVLLSAIIAKEPIRRRDLLALGLTYGGVALVIVSDAANLSLATHRLTGIALVLAAAFAYAVYLFGSQKSIRAIGAARYTAIAMLAAVTGVLLHYMVGHSARLLLSLPLPIYGYGLALGVFSTVLPSLLISIGVGRIGANKVAIIGALGPVATIVLAQAILHETIGIAQVIGAALILIGVGLTMAKPRIKVDAVVQLNPE